MLRSRPKYRRIAAPFFGRRRNNGSPANWPVLRAIEGNVLNFSLRAHFFIGRLLRAVWRLRASQRRDESERQIKE
jgi:hypothetical protein